MEKVSHTKIAQVLRDTQHALVTVTDERDKLAAENAVLKRRHECEKLAAKMHSRGLETDKTAEELVEHLEKEASAGNFETINKAVDYVGPNGSFGASVSAHVAGGGHDAFTSYL